MPALLALAPIAVILVLMVGRQWSAAAAGPVGLLIAAAVALGAYGFGLGADGLAPLPAYGGTALEAVFVAATILWIIFPALCLFELQSRHGAFDVLRAALARLSADPRITALLIAWFFALFVEGAAGFGTPVALAAPMLVTLGFAPVQAVTLVLIGHAAGVSFGAVGTPVLPQIAATPFTGFELARATGLLHGLLGWVLLVFAFRIAGAATDPDHHDGRGWLWAGVAGLCFLVPFLALSAVAGPELPTLAGALVGLVLFVAILHLFHADRDGGGDTPGLGRLGHALLPYGVLLALILVTRLIPELRGLLQDFAWEWRLFGQFGGAFQPLYHPGTMLFAGFLIGGLIQGRSSGELRTAAGSALRRLPKVALALVAMLALARLMVHAGMIEALALAAAGLFGPAWPVLAPAVGALGTFVTGSATASNILFTDFQLATAEALGLPLLLLIAAQGFGAAVGNIVCPHNIIAGGATVGLGGREGEVLRRTGPACAVYALAGGLLVLALATVF
ncbi:MAG: L-lactate permease [Alphaproteobacteria bacterium]|jgi:lactate permease|nr:L-lactate permease [Alphaproteobacteria bacterium]